MECGQTFYHHIFSLLGDSILSSLHSYFFVGLSVFNVSLNS